MDVERGLPRSPATPGPARVQRDDMGTPTERWEAVLTALPAAVFPPSPSDAEVFKQLGQDVSMMIYLKADPSTGVLPDARVRDRVEATWPTGGTRYFEVLTSQDVGEAGILRELRCRERYVYP